MDTHTHTQTITITFGDYAENHRGMEIISAISDKLPSHQSQKILPSAGVEKDVIENFTEVGQRENEAKFPTSHWPHPGLSVNELEKIAESLIAVGFSVELCHLDHTHSDITFKPAAILIIRGGIDKILTITNKGADDMYTEHAQLTPDKMILAPDGRVVKKVARWNLCYGEHSQESDIAAGRGTIISWSDVPVTNAIRKFISILHPKLRHLVGEGNFYYNPETCGIRPHQDLERSVVAAVRLGVSMPLFYQWFYYGRPVGNIMRFDLHHGDMYIMSTRAVNSRPTSSSDVGFAPILKHWACGPKFRI